jgi:hypothetical protein
MIAAVVALYDDILLCLYSYRFLLPLTNPRPCFSEWQPGGADRLRKKLASNFTGQNQGLVDRVGTVHDLRFLIFDNDTRLLFASTFDGDWDAYINDFAAYIPNEIDMIWGEVEDFPGIRSPNVKDYIVKYQVPATYFYSAYPNASVRDVWKAMKIKGGLDVLLDAETS